MGGPPISSRTHRTLMLLTLMLVLLIVMLLLRLRIWSIDRGIPGFGGQTIKFNDLEWRPSNSMS